MVLFENSENFNLILRINYSATCFSFLRDVRGFYDFVGTKEFRATFESFFTFFNAAKLRGSKGQTIPTKKTVMVSFERTLHILHDEVWVTWNRQWKSLLGLWQFFILWSTYRVTRFNFLTLRTTICDVVLNEEFRATFETSYFKERRKAAWDHKDHHISVERAQLKILGFLFPSHHTNSSVSPVKFWFHLFPFAGKRNEA